jgi:methyl-accepting chemotaxis protein
MRSIAENHLDIDPPKQRGSGEIAEFARAAGVFLENARSRNAAIATAEEADLARKEMEKALEEARLARIREREAEEARAAEVAARQAAEEARLADEEEKRALAEAEERRKNEEEAKLSTKRRLAAEARAKEEAELAASLAQLMNELGGSLRQLASGDLTCEITTFFSEEFKPLRLDFNDALRKLRHSMVGVVDGTDEVKSIAGRLDDASITLAVQTERQSKVLVTNNEAIKRLSEHLTSSAEGAEATRVTAEQANSKITSCSEVMKSAVSAMDSIERSSAKISTIVSVIEDITFQTNLLALNAGVEAARAGEAGRGFSVVASEVRALAQRAAESSQEIKDLISESNAQIGNGVGLVKQTGQTLEDVSHHFTEISEAVSTLSQGALTQTEALEEVNKGAEELNQSTRENLRISNDTREAADALLDQVERVAKTLSVFKIEDESDAKAA